QTTIAGLEGPIAELRRSRSTLYFDGQAPPKAVIHAYVFAGPEQMDRALDALAQIKTLQFLNQWELPVPDEGLAKLSGRNELGELSLSHTKVTDSGLEHLKGMTKLERLALNGLSITDTGLARLHGLRNLKTLWLTGTKVTPEGVAALKKVMPNADVTTDA